MYSDEDEWSDPDQLTHYFYLKNRYGYACAAEFAERTQLNSYGRFTSDEEDDEIDYPDIDEYEQDGWIQEDLSEEEICELEEEHGTPLRKKRKISETSEEEEEGCSANEQ